MSNRVSGGDYNLLIRLIKNLLKRKQTVRLLFLESRWEDMDKITRLDQEMKKNSLPENNICARERIFVSSQS